MTEIVITKPQPSDVPDLGRICFAAFCHLQDHHRVQRSFPDPEIAIKVMGLFVSRPEFYGVAASIDKRLAGSNFITFTDEVCGVGPITIDPEVQGKGIGRRLMSEVLHEAERRGRKRIRLVQEAVNTVSSPLYAALGFVVREPLAWMSINPARAADTSVREAAPQDSIAIDDLGRRFYKVCRGEELTIWQSAGMKLLVRERNNRLTGYFLPGKLGHGVAESVEDALALIGEAGRCVPPEFANFICPMRDGDFYRAALKAGHRVGKILTLMSMGPYEEPQSVWMPSYLY